MQTSEISDVMAAATDQHGRALRDITSETKVLLCFVRHFGCVFCREAARDISQARRSIEANGVRIAFVHMGTSEQGAEFLAKYGLTDVSHFSDPGKSLFRAFGLQRATLPQLFAPKAFARGFIAFFSGNGVGAPVGDPMQMPGVFLIEGDKITCSFVHQLPSDRPDYVAMSRCDPAICGPLAAA